ncbi:MAG: N-acetylmuramoyl-L-alanine amidase [Kiritimatiellae bacterium]|nr:N-acetylmuramoyl-L-alanine amidase [Kiritimatiellia bacterium]
MTGPARGVLLAAAFLAATRAFAVDASNRYRSPRNPERKIRPTTELIVLHTTEAPARSSLAKVSERGECHYCVTEEGVIYRIVDRDKEAFHAGRSMWKGKEDVDKFSIGIECVGYHDQAMGTVQLAAIRDLVDDLKKMYRLTDDKVVTQSQVAYGRPNKWQKHNHRGRKRCGMLFAMPSVRRVLGLKTRAASDPDVKAGRLVVGDDYLAKVLYGNIDTFKSTYARVKTSVPPPVRQDGGETGGGFFSRLFGSPKTAEPKPAPKTALKWRAPASIEDLKKMGYVKKGVVKPGVTAASIAGGKWNYSTTYYTIRDKVIPGNLINPAKIEVGMEIWMKKQ